MTPLITAVDHVIITTADFDADLRHYVQLLGSEASPTGSAPSRRATLDGGNLAVHLQERAGVDTGLAGLCFQVPDLPRLRRRLQRLDLPLHRARDSDGRDSLEGAATGVTQIWLAPSSDRSYRLGFTDQPTREPSRVATGVAGLDHVVVASGDATQTAFLLAAQLGLDLRMDLSRPDWNARLLFFRCGDTIVEVFEELTRDHGAGAAADRLYGLSWRVTQAAERRAELAGLGFDVSELRRGRKAGTQVFTVRDRCAGVATLMLQPPV